jgi:MFS family permease
LEWLEKCINLKLSVSALSLWPLINVFVWYFLASQAIDFLLRSATVEESFIAWTVYYCAILGSALVGSIVAKEENRNLLLTSWTALGIVTSFLPLLVQGSSVELTILISIILGVSLGFGVPSCLALLSMKTPASTLGKKGGAIFLSVNVFGALFGVLIQNVNFGIIHISLVAALWRSTVLMTLAPTKMKHQRMPEDELVMQKHVSFKSIIMDRAFALYFVCWLLFCFIDRFEKPILLSFLEKDFVNLLYIIEPLIGSVSAFIGGILADRMGRKRIAILGFVSFGLAYAALGIAPFSTISQMIYSVLDAIGTGILWVLFIIVLWGDLSPIRSKEKCYLLGVMPYFATAIVGLAVPIIFTESQLASLAYATFSIASIFLFLAVLPLLFAPETLPEKNIKERELKGYVEKAKKTKEKYT